MDAAIGVVGFQLGSATLQESPTVLVGGFGFTPILCLCALIILGTLTSTKPLGRETDQCVGPSSCRLSFNRKDIWYWTPIDSQLLSNSRPPFYWRAVSSRPRLSIWREIPRLAKRILIANVPKWDTRANQRQSGQLPRPQPHQAGRVLARP